MTGGTLLRRSLAYFWRTHLAVAFGVAVAVGVLAGALLVGDSVRGSLRELFLDRLGRTGTIVVANDFFRDAVAEELAEDAVPLIAFRGMVTHATSGSRRRDVDVFGVDDRFFRFHGIEMESPEGRDAIVSPGLAAELGVAAGDALLLRVEQPSAVARGSLHGDKDDTGRTVRLGAASVDGPELSLYPSQDTVRAIFVGLSRLQRDLGQEGRVNTVLVGTEPGADEIRRRVGERLRLEDLGVRLRQLDRGRGIAVESDALMLSEPVAAAARAAAAELGAEATGILTYLANVLRVGEREVPYSLVSALEEPVYRSLVGAEAPMAPSLVLNDWAAAELGAAPGDRLTMEYYLWRTEGLIATESSEFVVDAIVPMTGWAADPELAPDYPGISGTDDLSDWDPPFPVDLSAIRDQDEAYWDDHRTTPKAFIRLARGQRMWPVQQGRHTSIRIETEAPVARVEEAMRADLDPLELGWSVAAVREEGLEASEGATDFGEYFLYFSYFLMMAALLLTGLFFKLGIEQRLTEIGALRAVGFSTAKLRRLYLAEGFVLAVAGGVLGLVLAVGYAWLVMYGLRTFWVDAVGTTLLSLHVGGASLVIGALSGIAAAALAIGWTLRHLESIPPRRLLAGQVAPPSAAGASRSSRRAVMAAFAALGVAALLVVGARVPGLSHGAGPVIGEAAAFFGAGNLLLVALLLLQWVWLRAPRRRRPVAGTGAPALTRLGFRNATYRPGRSLVATALIAFATFTIVSVDAFRKDDAAAGLGEDTGTGGYALFGESLLPFHWDPASEAGRDALNLPFEGDPDDVPMRFATLRLRDGDDASCLNLYRPQNPRIVGLGDAFLAEARFRFAEVSPGPPEAEANPWLLLKQSFPDGAVPVIGDANSMAYVLHLGIGEDFVLSRVGRSPLVLRLVATLSDSLFQGELLMSEESFLAHFPEVDGFRMLLAETPEPEAAATLLEQRMADYGLDVETTAAKLAEFHRVENTYLSTFQTLGGLGLLLGTLGLGSVLLRNVLERRRELALLRAVGFRRGHFTAMILAENALLLVLGLATGLLAALVAIAPALASRGDGVATGSLALLLAGVFLFGMLSSRLAVASAARAPLLASLRAE